MNTNVHSSTQIIGSHSNHNLSEFDQPQPWDMLQNDSTEQNNNVFLTYAQVKAQLATLQEPDVSFDLLKNALDVVHDHFNDIHADSALYKTILCKLGCDVDEDGSALIVETMDGKHKGKEAIRMQLHTMAQVIGVIHMTLLKCNDVRAAKRHGMSFDDDDINVKLAELYYRQSAFAQRALLDYDIAHPMADSSHVLLNKAMTLYQEHAAFYRFMDGSAQNLGRKAHRNTDMIFMIYFTIYQLRQHGFRVKGKDVYKQIIIPKRKPIPTARGADGFPEYRCCHKNKLGQPCNKLRWEHKHPIKHLWKCNFDISSSETWNTHFWEPISDQDFAGLDNASINEFVYKVAGQHGKATSILQSNKQVAADVENFLVRSFSNMVDFLEPQERTYSCWNGILIDSTFYAYDDLPPEHKNICVNKFFPSWYFVEEDERFIRGKPCGCILQSDFFKQYERPPKFRFDGYVQNVYCSMCALPHDMVNHSKCGFHMHSCSSSSAITAKPILLCTICQKNPHVCKCASGPTLYRLGNMRYLHAPTIHWDQLIMTQIKGMTIASPTEQGSFITLPESEHMDTYRWATALYFRPNFRIGPHAKVFEGETSTKFKSPYADNWRVAAIFDGETNTGKTASIEMVKIYLPEFGNLSDKNNGRFMLEQCVESNKFKPILMGEMGANSFSRTLYCALVDACTVIPVSRKGISDVNAICDRQITLLCNDFKLAGGDVEGSVKSRMALLKYQVQIPTSKVDGELLRRNMNDPIPLVRMGNHAYMQLSKCHGHQHFAEICPRIFLENRKRFEEQSNPLRQFLNQPFSETHGQLVLHPDVYMLRKDLIEAFRDHCKLNGVPIPPWKDDAFDLRKSKIRKAPIGLRNERGEPTTEQYMFGIAPINSPIAKSILQAQAQQPIDASMEDSNTMKTMEKLSKLFRELNGCINDLSTSLTVTESMTDSLVQHENNLKSNIEKLIDMRDTANTANAVDWQDIEDEEFD